jgi:hypothetical protein
MLGKTTPHSLIHRAAYNYGQCQLQVATPLIATERKVVMALWHLMGLLGSLVGAQEYAALSA